MINERHINAMPELRQQWEEAKPFRHLVLDDFLGECYADRSAAELELTTCDGTSWWQRQDHTSQVKKWWCSDPERLPLQTAANLIMLNSLGAGDWLTGVTGIEGLIGDSTYAGGGVHIHTTGGSLGVHADFNRHPITDTHRRLNLLLFLNRDWRPEWGGQLELWSAFMCPCAVRGKPNQACPKCKGLGWLPDEGPDVEGGEPVLKVSVDPVFNRAVLLETTDYGFHGVAPIACPPNVRRISLALYYYSLTRPEHESSSDFHWSLWPSVPMSG